jgi:hypothetical protein
MFHAENSKLGTAFAMPAFAFILFAALLLVHFLITRQAEAGFAAAKNKPLRKNVFLFFLFFCGQIHAANLEPM